MTREIPSLSRSRLAVSAFLISLCLTMFTGSAEAQVPISFKNGVASGDTVRVELVVGSDTMTLPQPVSSFQFAVSVEDSLVAFLDIDTNWTMSEKSGWTVRANPENGRVGGFSSLNDAFQQGGTLVTLMFRVPERCYAFQLDLLIFKLNAGNPNHMPLIPSGIVGECPQ